MTLEHQTTLAMQAIDRLLGQFRGKPNVEAVLTALVGEVQALEDALFELLELRTIDDAIGEQLDLLGRIVGQARAGMGDEDYRVFLRARVLINISKGTTDELLVILRAITQGANTYLAYELYPATLLLRVGDTFALDPVMAAYLLKLARPAGVAVDLEYTLTLDADTFTFADSDDSEYDAQRGFEEELHEGEFTGGDWAEAERAI